MRPVVYKDENTMSIHQTGGEDKHMAEPQYSQIGIDKLNLSVRSYNCLRRAKIDTIQALLDVYNQGKLIEIRNLGIINAP